MSPFLAKVGCVGLAVLGLTRFEATSRAAGEADARTPWFARVWQSEDGLPENNVTGLAQTPDGYLWISSHNGLVR